MIPGNSEKEIAVERAMEKAVDILGDVVLGLRRVANRIDDSDDGPEDTMLMIRKVQLALEECGNDLDEAYHAIDGVLDD